MIEIEVRNLNFDMFSFEIQYISFDIIIKKNSKEKNIPAFFTVAIFLFLRTCDGRLRADVRMRPHSRMRAYGRIRADVRMRPRSRIRADAKWQLVLNGTLLFKRILFT